MTATGDLDAGLLSQPRPNPAIASGNRCQRGDRVELPEPGGNVQEVTGRSRDPPAELRKKRLLPRDDRPVGVEHQALLFLQLGRDVTLAVDQGLLAHVFGRHRLAIGMTDFEVVAEDLIEADLERANRGALTLPLLQVGDPLARGVGTVVQTIELRIEAAPK